MTSRVGQGAPRLVDVSLGSLRLRLDPAYIRHAEDKSGGPMNELMLAARFDSFRPAPAATPLQPDMTQADADVVIMLLRPADATLNPADRTSKLYARFLESDTWSHPGGLVMRRFSSKGPYTGEELYIAPPEGRRFAARCIRPRQNHDGLPDTCVADLRVEAIDVNVRFSPDLLPDWEKLVTGVEGLVLSMTR